MRISRMGLLRPLLTSLVFLSLFITARSQDNLFSQAANADAGYALGTAHWIGSILNKQNSRYTEGMSTLQRLILVGMPAAQGNVHTVTFDVQATKGDNHAYDFLTSWDQALAYAATVGSDLLTSPVVTCGPNPSSDPKGYLTSCTAAHANTANSAWASLTNSMTDPIATSGGVDAKRLAYNAAFPSSGVVRIWGTSPVTNASVTFNGYNGNSGNQLANYTVTFTTAAGSDVVLEFAGHLAVGTGGYGTDLGASAIGGGPYHFKLGSIDGTAGSQDNQIEAGDVIIPPTCNLAGPTSACLSTTSLSYSANADVADGAVTYKWYLLNNTAGAQFSGGVVNPESAMVTVVPTGSTFTSGGSFNLKVEVSRGGLTHTCYLNSETAPGDLVQISNLNATPTATPNSLNLAVATTSQLHAGPTGGATPYTYSWSADPANGSLSSHSIENPVFTTTHVGLYNYTVTVTDNQNCTVTKPIGIAASVNQANPCQVNGPANVCQNSTHNAYTVTWDNPGGYTTAWSITGAGAFNPVPAATDGTVYVDAGASGSYTVRFDWTSPTGLDFGFCTVTTTIVANPAANPASQHRCSSTSTATFDLSSLQSTITGGAANVNVTWFSDAALTQSISTPGSYTSGTATVYAKVTNLTSCTSSTPVSLVVDANPVLLITDPAPVCRPATINLTIADITAGSTLPAGTVLTYWTDVSATTSIADPATISTGGTFYIKATTLANCFDIEAVHVAFMDCGNVFYTVTQGKYGNFGGLACTPDGQMTTVQLYQYTIDKTPNDVLVVGSNGRELRVRKDATVDDPTSTTDVPAATSLADISGMIAALPGGGKSAVLPTGTVYSNAIPSSWLKNGRLTNTLLAQTVTLSLNSYISGNLNNFELQSGKDLYSIKRAPGTGCTSTETMTCLQGNPYINVGRLNTAVVSYLQSVALAGTLADGKAYVSELIALANMALGNQLPAYSGLTLDAIAGVEDQINNVFDQGAIFSSYGTPSAPTCPVITTLTTLNSVIMGNVRDNTTGQPTELVKNLQATAYPNPARGSFSIKMISPVSGNANIQIMTIDGKTIYNRSRYVEANQQVIVPVIVTTPGQLIYRLSIGNKIVNGKLTNLE